MKNKMTGKKTLLILMVLTMALVLFGCVETNEEGNMVYQLCEGVTLVNVGDIHPYEIFVHEETGVMYVSEHNYGLTVMVDANGNPLIWKG